MPSNEAPTLRVDGRSAVIAIIGDPVAQVKAPGPLSALMQQRGHDAVVVPLHVRHDDLGDLLGLLWRIPNFAGLVVTVPHKQAVAELGLALSPAAAAAQAVNVVRRSASGWEGDLIDGTGFVQGLRDNGFDPAGRSAVLVGAGGAGSAIAFALGAAGVRSLALHDSDAGRQANLIARLREQGCPAAPWDQRSGADLLVNATPVGMCASDPYPLAPTLADAATTVAEVIMEPATTRLLEVVQARGARIVRGRHMMEAQLDAMTDYFGVAVGALREREA